MDESSELRYLDIYLDDHRALAIGGVELAERMKTNHRESAWAERLGWLFEQVRADHATLDHIRDELGIEGGMVKGAVAYIGERLGRLKLNGHLLSASPLSPVVETESMIAVVRAKQSLWRSLRASGEQWPQLSAFDFVQLEKQADEQIELLESIHFDVAQRAFAGEGNKSAMETS